MLALRHKLVALIGAMALVGVASSLGATAGAQSYPPGSSVPSCTVGNVTISTPLNVGQSITFTLCGGFAAGANVTVKVNNVTTVNKTPVNGFVTVVVTAVSNSTLSIGDPVNVAAICGTNTVVATGSGNPGSSTGTFTLNCTSTTTTSGGSLPLTGADVVGVILVAVALIVLGAVLVVMQRRRRQSI